MLSGVDYNLGITESRKLGKEVKFLDLLAGSVMNFLKKFKKVHKTTINKKLLRVDVVDYIQMVLVKQSNENGVIYNLVHEEDLVFSRDGTFLKYYEKEVGYKDGNVYQLEEVKTDE
jgi:hypothetical protein